ncbi:MAG: hypothetical protein WAM66_12100 [Acidobacteriaceae bacterium]
MILWRLFQYVSPMKRRAIGDWRTSLSIRRRADMDVFIRNMAKKKSWVYPDIRFLSGRHLKGFLELRWRSENVPHRIGGYFAADDEFVMLLGWTHNANKYDPPTALELLLKRKNYLLTGEASLDGYSIFTGHATEK